MYWKVRLQSEGCAFAEFWGDPNSIITIDGHEYWIVSMNWETGSLVVIEEPDDSE